MAALIFTAAGATDFLDGWLARRRGLVTVIGKFMDPLADKLVVVSALVMLVHLGRVAAWVVIVIMAREFIITGLRAVASSEGIVIAASQEGKYKTSLQIAAIAFLFLHYRYVVAFLVGTVPVDANVVGTNLLYLSLAFSLWSAGRYIRDFIRAVYRKDELAGEADPPHPAPGAGSAGAAGRGKRQRPYTDATPKPLLEVNGRATLDYVLTAVTKAGIERVCLVTNHLEEKIIEYVSDGSSWKLDVTFAHQAELNGNGDALLSVPKEWIHNEPVMVMATDYILEEKSLLELVNAHKQHNADITMSLKECPAEELMARSSVDVDSNWRVKRIIEKPKREEIMSPYAASILFIVPASIWEYLSKIQPSPRGEIEIGS